MVGIAAAVVRTLGEVIVAVVDWASGAAVRWGAVWGAAVGTIWRE